MGLARAYFSASLQSMCRRIADLRLETDRSVGSLAELLGQGGFPEDEEALSAWMQSMESLMSRLEVLEGNTSALHRLVMKKKVRNLPEGA